MTTQHSALSTQHSLDTAGLRRAARDHSALSTQHSALPIGLCAQIACIWEATARKPGNVHRYRDFADTSYVDFLVSAAAIAPWVETASQRPVGETILQAVRATRDVVSTNTNLGIILLLAPLAAVPRGQELRPGLGNILNGLNVNDARAVYEAIRIASPGGLGEVAEQDVSQEPTLPLPDIMALAADRDLIARQYVNGFREVFDKGVPAIMKTYEQTGDLEQAIVGCHVYLMASYPDSLIARKCGVPEAVEAAKRAALVSNTGETDQEQLVGELDSWLTEEGHRRNPGTTADLVAACLFVVLREGKLGEGIVQAG